MSEQVQIEDEWPGGVSDGLVLPCGACGDTLMLDYTVSDETWALVDSVFRLGVLCLDCLGEMVGRNTVVSSLECIQVIGATCTAYAVVEKVYLWPGTVEATDE